MAWWLNVCRVPILFQPYFGKEDFRETCKSKAVEICIGFIYNYMNHLFIVGEHTLIIFSLLDILFMATSYMEMAILLRDEISSNLPGIGGVLPCPE